MLFYYHITAPANTNVIIISVLLITAGGLMIVVSICGMASIANYKDSAMYFCFMEFVCFSTIFALLLLCIVQFLCVPLLIIFALIVGSVAGSMSGPVSVMSR